MFAWQDTNSGRLVLEEEDWEVFVEVLANPPEPNQALRDAFAAYDRMIAKMDE